MSFRCSALRAASRLLAALLLLALPAPAAADDAAIQRQADERFQEGKALLAQGEIAAACLKLEQSLALLRRGGTLLNLAVCREKEGRQATAMRLFQEAIQLAISDKRADREQLARERLAEVRTKVSWIEIKPAESAGVPGLAVRCDDQPVPPESWGSPMAFDAGTHRIEATAPGYAPFEVSVTLATPGEHRTVTLAPLVPIEAPSPTVTASATATATATWTATLAPTQTATLAPTTAAPLAAPGAWRKPTGIAAVAVGFAAAALGGAFGVKAIVDNDATRKLCPNNRCPTEEGIGRNRDARTDALVADVALPVGLVAASFGVFLLLTARAPVPAASGKAAGVATPRANGGGVSLLPGAGPQGGFLSLRGAW